MKNRFSLQEVENFYDRIIHRGYEEHNIKTDSYMRRFSDAFSLGSTKEEATVLDVGCGIGYGIVYFGQKLKTKGIGVDISENMLREAKSKLDESNMQFLLIKADAEILPFPNESFDYVVSFETIEHTPTPQRFIDEISRVLKPHGELILTTPNVLWDPIHQLAALLCLHHDEGPHNFVNRRKLISLLKNARLKIKKEKTTVLIPIGPGFLLKFGRFLENLLPEGIMRLIGLRRNFICEKIE